MAGSDFKGVILDTIDKITANRLRPDLHRICHMLERRQGLSPTVVKAQLQKLIDGEIVMKVDYKGDISYRNTAKWSKWRKRKYRKAARWLKANERAEELLKTDNKLSGIDNNGEQEQQTSALLQQRVCPRPDRPCKTEISSFSQTSSKRARLPSRRKRIKKTHGPDFLETTSLPSSDSEDPRCDFCFLSASCNRMCVPEDLLFCRDCNAKAHPSCMDYGAELAKRSKMGPWQCIDCKTCTICEDAKDSGSMLFCDACDKGYHMGCHDPKITEHPKGKWICQWCTADAKEYTDSNPSNLPSEQTNGIIGRRLGRINKSTGLPIPCDSPVPGDIAQGDLSNNTYVGAACNKNTDIQYPDVIPDAKNWTIADVEKFLISVGFSEQAAIFKHQEIDGKSLLLMKRSDVLTGLAIKLGPALKIYNHIKRLQSRTPFQCQDIIFDMCKNH